MFQNIELNSSKIDWYSLIEQSPNNKKVNTLIEQSLLTIFHDNAKNCRQLRSIMQA